MIDLRSRVILLSLMVILTLSVVFTSCEQEELLPIGPTITEKTSATETLEVNPNNQQLYIVTFNTENSDKSAVFAQLKGKSREDARKAAEKMSENFRSDIKKVTTQLNVAEERISDYYTFIDAAAITLSKDEAEALKKSPLVSSIEADRYIDVTLPEVEELTDEIQAQADTKSDHVGRFNHNHGGYDANGASRYTWIWIIDTGIDLDHPELNVITNTAYARSFVGGNADDCHGHGTHVAGIAAARKNNFGMVGMSAGAPVVPIRIMGCSGGGFPTSRLVSAINHVAINSVAGDVVNMSISGYGGLGTSLTNALNTLSNRGVYGVIAAGNKNANAKFFYPASYNSSKIKTIASMDPNGNFSSFSNFGIGTVDYIATGRNIYSTYKSGGYAMLSGTSMATPVAAGIIHARGGLPATRGRVLNRGKHYKKVRL